MPARATPRLAHARAMSGLMASAFRSIATSSCDQIQMEGSSWIAVVVVVVVVVDAVVVVDVIVVVAVVDRLWWCFTVKLHESSIITITLQKLYNNVTNYCKVSPECTSPRPRLPGWFECTIFFTALMHNCTTEEQCGPPPVV